MIKASRSLVPICLVFSLFIAACLPNADSNDSDLTDNSVAPSASVPTPVISSYKCVARGQLPDPVCTPGSIDSRVTQDNISTTICVSGYTRSVRPPVSFTNSLKIAQMRAYGDVDANGNLMDPSGFEEDHLIPLELGGNPTEATNLWPEPQASPNPKDAVENASRRAVCAQENPMSLAHAQELMAKDWQALGKELGVK